MTIRNASARFPSSIECCERRDTKGLYKAARDGKIKNFTGINDPFECPMNSDLIIDGDELHFSIEYNLKKILNKIYE